MNSRRLANILLITHLLFVLIVIYKFISAQWYDILPPANKLIEIANNVFYKANVAIIACIISLIFYFFSKYPVSIIISGLAIIYCLI